MKAFTEQKKKKSKQKTRTMQMQTNRRLKHGKWPVCEAYGNWGNRKGSAQGKLKN